MTVVGAVAGAAVSIWIGRRTQRDPRWLWYVVPLNVIAAITVPAFLAAAFAGGSFGLFHGYNDYGRNSGYNPPANGLQLDGNQISNIYPFDAQGKQIDVRLYDQDGNPISLDLQDCATTYGRSGPYAESNAFPQPTIIPDPNGDTTEDTCRQSAKATFVPPPAPATTPPVTPPTNKFTPTPGASNPIPPTATPPRPSAGPGTTKPSATPSSRPPTVKPPGSSVTLTVQPNR